MWMTAYVNMEYMMYVNHWDMIKEQTYMGFMMMSTGFLETFGVDFQIFWFNLEIRYVEFAEFSDNMKNYFTVQDNYFSTVDPATASLDDYETYMLSAYGSSPLQ